MFFWNNKKSLQVPKGRTFTEKVTTIERDIYNLGQGEPVSAQNTD